MTHVSRAQQSSRVEMTTKKSLRGSARQMENQRKVTRPRSPGYSAAIPISRSSLSFSQFSLQQLLLGSMVGAKYKDASNCVINGHTGRLLGRIDSEGRRCGVDQEVIDKPLWFRCPARENEDQFEGPFQGRREICLEACPEVIQDVKQKSKCGDYKLRDEWRRPMRFGMICSKSGAKYVQLAKAWFPLSIDSFTDFAMAQSILIFIIVSSILLSYAALILCRTCAWFAAVLFTFLIITVPLVFGVGSWINAESIGYPWVFKGLAILSFLAACWAAITSWYYWQSTVKHVVVCIKCASDTIFHMPVLVFTTLWKSFSCVALTIVVMYGVAMFHTSGNDKTENEVLGGSRARLPVTIVHFLVSVWIVSVSVSLKKFSCFYSVAEYYYAPWSSDGKCKQLDRKYWLPLRAYFVGAYYHSGSLALGSFCTLAQKIVFGVLMLISFVFKCISCLPLCCVDCSKFLSKREAVFQGDLAYLYIAMCSKDYCSASYRISHESDEMRFVAWIVFAFSFTCSVAIALLNVVIMHWAIHGGVWDPVECGRGLETLSFLSSFMVARSCLRTLELTTETLFVCLRHDMLANRPLDTAPYEMAAAFGNKEEREEDTSK
eukprot:TRINITY_DN17344_c0_g1_i2.p1 TRINITY_DN17344_c0_g1~~TRINITY_DN17344_c0_g1_i2.p1  ORF type:complete len:604 (+),score=54.85 TRINITY_DN17344_c0_g1_i2:385-2196(+)